jgi:hypothetical protein
MLSSAQSDPSCCLLIRREHDCQKGSRRKRVRLDMFDVQQHGFCFAAEDRQRVCTGSTARAVQEQALPELITGAQLLKSQPKSGLQGLVGYERGQAVYLELNARGETARKVLLQDKPEEAILNLRARQVAGTIYVLGNVYRNNGRGFIEKLAFVALEGIAHR